MAVLSRQEEKCNESKTQSKKVNKAWLNDHVNDTYVKLAQKEGYRARSLQTQGKLTSSLA